MRIPIDWFRLRDRVSRHGFSLAGHGYRRQARRLHFDGLESRCLLSLAINEFPDGLGPEGIVSGPDGNLWFTENGGNKIGQINPTTHSIVDFPLPPNGGGPAGITAGPDGNLWFTVQTGNSIGQINPTTGTVVEFPIPTPGATPLGITAGPDGNLWFTEPFGTSTHGGQVGQINPATHVITEFPTPTASSSPAFITAGADGNLWFTEQKGNKIGQIDPTTHVITEFSLPTPGSAPQGITGGPDGNLWFTELGGNKIGQINPTTHDSVEFPIPTATSIPESITSGPDGNLWFAESNGTKIGQINPTTHTIVEFPVPTAGSLPTGIASGPDGNVWFTELFGNRIGQAVLKASASAPDLALTGNAPGSVTLGGNVTYSLTVTNNGTADATGVQVTDTLPANVTFVSATDGVTPAHDIVTFVASSLAAGSSATFSIVVTPLSAGTLSNLASASATETDLTPGDNSINQVTIVTALSAVSGPVVTSVQRFGFHVLPTTLVLTFDRLLDPARAQNPDNYQIVALGGAPRGIRITSATYNPSTRTVTLRPAHRLNLHRLFRLTVVGTGAGGVTDVSGNRLDGQDAPGSSGSNFLTIVSAADLVLTTTSPANLRAYKKILRDQAAWERHLSPAGEPGTRTGGRR
jgi:uncharacterized repeat protein (TIGR01451 family)